MSCENNAEQLNQWNMKLRELTHAYNEPFLGQNQEIIDETLDELKDVNVVITATHLNVWYKEWLVSSQRFCTNITFSGLEHAWIQEVIHLGEWVDELHNYMEEKSFYFKEMISKAHQKRLHATFDDIVNAR